MQEQQVQVIDGPVVPGISAQPLYQVTLASGAIATRPSAFADYRPDAELQHVTVAQNGEVLGLP
jgi:hypothetical protein